MEEDKAQPQGALPEIQPVRTLSVHLLNTGQFAMNFPKDGPDDFNTSLIFLIQGLMILQQEMVRAKKAQDSRIVKPNLVLPKDVVRPRG